jgi:hypothetical protein
VPVLTETPSVPRKKATPKNPYGAAVGQKWSRRVHPHAHFAADFIITKVDLQHGFAVTESQQTFKQFGWRPRRTKIRLERLAPRYGYYLKEN